MKNKIKDALGSSLFIIAILVIISLFTLMPIVNMLILGGIIAYGLRPVAKKLQTKLKYPSISIILSIILIIIPLILIFAYTISVAITLSYSFISSNQDILNSFSLNNSLDAINTYLPPQMQSSTTTITSTITEVINDILKLVFGYLVNFIQSLPFVMLQIFVLIFSIFYFTKDGHKISEYIYSFIPNEKHEFFSNMINEVKTVLKSIFYGHFLTGFVIGSMAAIGFFILGYPYALFLGILTGVGQLIPVIGPWPVYTGLFIYDMVSGNYIRGILVLLFGFGLSLSDMYIRPTLAGKYVDIHPMILLLGFMAGPLVFGLVGFILGPLILGITYAVIKAYKEEKEKLEMEELKNEKKEAENCN
ncbi:AI-2E family transporter [Methanobrevibacter sp. TMH8]|uniref:AI-2E family transporter n=1 Tax=Methanobrevibacter sp. TMH8 TaxID=2848611 RepID=UPI001CC982B5|nr:AI-2E family transporter [Methanobrevibacter sp. TMH8]MBZ9571433.1 AI-2E family transporter [Methanobrevibacter sp. TMH8]